MKNKVTVITLLITAAALLVKAAARRVPSLLRDSGGQGSTIPPGGTPGILTITIDKSAKDFL